MGQKSQFLNDIVTQLTKSKWKIHHVTLKIITFFSNLNKKFTETKHNNKWASSWPVIRTSCRTQNDMVTFQYTHPPILIHRVINISRHDILLIPIPHLLTKSPTTPKMFPACNSILQNFVAKVKDLSRARCEKWIKVVAI